MTSKARTRKVFCSGCLTLAISVSSNCGAVEPQQKTLLQAETGKGKDTLYYMDLAHPSVRQPIDTRKNEAAGAKFVQVEVAEVVNPGKHFLTFQVQYEPTGDSKIVLGSFSLYPADNPGKFIVPTQGKVKNVGTIVVSMVLSEKVPAGDSIKVGIKELRFLKS